MSDQVHGDKILGDKVGRDKYQHTGRGGSINVNNYGEASSEQLHEAIAELRTFLDQLARDGLVADDGSITDPGRIVDEVTSQPSKFKALAAAIAGGAKEAVLAAVQEGAAKLVVALVGGQG